MIERYCTPVMTKIWSEENKFKMWLEVELAVLEAKVKMKKIPCEIFERTKAQANFTVERIEEIERDVHHDLLAFVQTVQEHLDEDLKPYFHADMTSYDTEEPATALILWEAIGAIFGPLDVLNSILSDKASQYKYLHKIGRTHGQHAEPITLGLMFLGWYDQLSRQRNVLLNCMHAIRFTKISGAVGTYAGGLSPELEAVALSILELIPAKISTQIICRDRHAHVMNALAVFAGTFENIALNIRLHGQTEICELQEPFGKKQKGSSRMPHKKNTILTENICGLARIVRHNAGAALENIATWGERDISHSSTERIIFADSFQSIHFALLRLTKVIEGLVVNENRIKENLDLTYGTIFSPDVKELLMNNGIDSDFG